MNIQLKNCLYWQNAYTFLRTWAFKFAWTSLKKNLWGEGSCGSAFAEKYTCKCISDLDILYMYWTFCGFQHTCVTVLTCWSKHFHLNLYSQLIYNVMPLKPHHILLDGILHTYVNTFIYLPLIDRQGTCKSSIERRGPSDSGCF